MPDINLEKDYADYCMTSSDLTYRDWLIFMREVLTPGVQDTGEEGYEWDYIQAINLALN